MNSNVVMHIDLNDAGRAAFAFVNVRNYLNSKPENGGKSVVIVANGPAVQFFVKNGENAGLQETARALMAEGVAIRLCNNALTAFKIARKDLLEGCEVVGGGINELIRLQNEGYSYIKP